ncbi:DUF4915 domain-containing protein [Acidithiobacillus thiooxidans]|uniref:DUF4915 domain-containing protein n=1 Tax=Acidithiobacillus thiooxidans TaxID=930 RepID=UPI001C07CEF6|nr:DUF4915 domain-containing protein [Acidithiobacillus thiooxidans]MBU2791906.1 DUF4915 domain-containing protein [Acidithiobacillus thiooxidans]
MNTPTNGNIFDHLLISAPNNMGGLYACADGRVRFLDDRPTCGISWSPQSGLLARAIQQGEALSITTPEGTREYAGDWGDLHDVLLDGEDLYLVSTQHNAVIRWNIREAVEIERRVFAEQEDSWHLNCLGRLRGKLFFSAFGEFPITRGYKVATLQRGFLRELGEGKGDQEETASPIGADGLSQPHSILETADGAVLCNSETGEVWRTGQDDIFRPFITLDGYTRGLAVRDGILYVGLSASRNASLGQDPLRAQIVAIDLVEGQEMARMSLPFAEVYGIIALPDQVTFLTLVAQVLEGERTRLLRQRNALAESLAMRINENIKLKISLGLPAC